MKKYLVAISILSTIPWIAFAQPPIDPPTPIIPIDAGASILLAAGAIFGAGKLYFQAKNKKEP